MQSGSRSISERAPPRRKERAMATDRRHGPRRGFGTFLVPGPLAAALLVSGLLLPQGELASQEAEGVSLHGTVRAEGIQEGGILPGAFVEVRGRSGARTGVADAEGRYRIDGLRGGAVRVAVFHLGAHPFEIGVDLPESGEINLDVRLERRALVMPGLTVRGRLHPESGTVTGVAVETSSVRSPPELSAFTGARLLDASTGMVEAGLTRGLEPPRDGQDPGPSRVLFMRGSTVDARTVLLDGAPVLTPFHVAGLVPPIEPELLGRAAYYLGGAPTRYEGGLSYLLDVTTRAPGENGFTGVASIDGLLARGSVEAGLPGGGGVLLAGRTLHGAQGAFGAVGHFPYDYRDLLYRAAVPLLPGHEFHFMGFRNREGVRLDEVILDRADARWGNRAASVRYMGSFGSTSVSAVAARSRYDSSLPLAWVEPVVARASSLRDRGAVELLLPRYGWDLHLGASGDRSDYRYLLDPRGSGTGAMIVGEERGMEVFSAGAWAEASSTYGERIDLRAGLRVDHFSGGHGVRLGPRVSAGVMLTEDARLGVALGRYHQPIPVPGLAERTTSRYENGELVSEEKSLDWHPAMPVASSNHLVISLDQSLDERLHFGVSGFVKEFEPLAPGEDLVRSSGTDLRLLRQGERVDAWLGYALSWFWAGGGEAATANFSGRHLVSAGFRGNFFDGLEIGLSAGYGAGLPLTSVALTDPMDESLAFRGFFGLPDERSRGVRALSSATAGASPLDVAPEDDFLRLDLEVAWVASTIVGSRSTNLRPYLRVLNALDSRDSLFHYLDEWRDGAIRPIARRAMLPVFGVEWRF
jgi:hypothetical protein